MYIVTKVSGAVILKKEEIVVQPTKILRRFVRTEGIGVMCIVTSENYSDELSFIEALYEEAKKDIPDLQRKDVKLKLYENGHWGLEFYYRGTLDVTYRQITALPRIK